MADVMPLAFAAPLSAGSIVAGKYRVDRVLAEGGMGLVYEGFHLALEQRIAVKVVRGEYLHHAEAIARFLDEARAVARLRGPHIAHVLDTGRTETGAPYMVLEYLDGRDLRTILDSEGPLSAELAVDYVLQACEAIAEAHALGIVHRDLKPENLFLTRGADGRGLIKVIDFGISKRLDDRGRALTQHGQSLGSPHYMAPEQMVSAENVDARADIWSLGVVLYELLGNVLPFGGATLPEACLQVLHAEPRPLHSFLPELDPELERVVMRCLEKRKEDRYASVHDLFGALAQFSQSSRSLTLGTPSKAELVESQRPERTLRSACEPLLAPGQRPLEARSRRRNPAALALLGAASLALVAALGQLAPGLLRQMANATSEPAAAHIAEGALPERNLVAFAEPALAEPALAEPELRMVTSETRTSVPPVSDPVREARRAVVPLKPKHAARPTLTASATAAPGAPSGDASELMNPYKERVSELRRESPTAQRALR